MRTIRAGRARATTLAAVCALALGPPASAPADGTAGGCSKSPPYSQPSDGCHFLLRGMPFHVYGRVKSTSSTATVRIRVWIELSTGREMLACEASGRGSAVCEEVDPDIPRVDVPGFIGLDDSRCYVEATVAPTFFCRVGSGT